MHLAPTLVARLPHTAEWSQEVPSGRKRGTLDGQNPSSQKSCQNPQSLQKMQLGAQEKVHGLRWDAELVCGANHIWEGYKSQDKNLVCSYCQGIGLGKVNGVGPA